MEQVAEIRLVTIERQVSIDIAPVMTEFDKVVHQPLFSKRCTFNFLTNVSDFVLFPIVLERMVRLYHIDVILAHSAPAGALAFMIWKKLKLPFYISSFEPHADYMVQSGIWKKYSLKGIFQRYWEHKQKRFATGLMPVAEYYSRQLLKEGIPKTRIFTVPCSVDASGFEFDSGIKAEFRSRWSWQKATVGIYAGKFGGLYYDDEAFVIYQKCFELIPDFCLIILTPDDRNTIEQKLLDFKIDARKVFLATVSHQDVPQYLSAADFAFATYKPGPSKKYLSPVKVGEYWANGLPVLLTEGIGDDSDIIKMEGGGALFNLGQEGSLEKAIQQIQEIIKNPTHRQEIPKLAQKYRSPDKIKEAYDYFFGTLEA